MAFLYPAFLIGGLAIAVPIVLHLLRREVAPEVPFTAVRLLQRAPVERADRRRLRDLMLLVARVAALLLLATVFARPYIQGAAPPPVRVVAIDRSYSMGAPGVFARALALAREAIDDAPGGERVAVVAFDDRADVLAAPGRAAEARASLDGLTPGSGATRYGAVFQQALDLAADASGRLVIVTDLQRAGWEGDAPPALPAGWSLVVRDALTDGVAALRSNVALTAVTVEAGRVVASIRNDGATAHAGRVRVVYEGQEVASADYTAGPRATTGAAVQWRGPQAGALSVRIEDGEGFPADNVRFAVLGGGAERKPLIVAGMGAGTGTGTGAGTGAQDVASGAGTPAALYLSRALGASSGGSVEVVPGSRVAEMSVESLSSHAGVALLDTRGLERAGRERLMSSVKAGGGLFIAAGPDLDVAILSEMTAWRPPLTAADQTGVLTFSPTDPRHPIFRPFGALAANLGQVRVERSWRVSPEGWSVVARFSNGTPALLERAAGDGRIVLFASDVDRRWNDFPLHPAFVPFALEALQYVSGERRQPREYTVAQAPDEAGRTPGVYRAADGRPFAVNVDTRESSLDRLVPADFEGSAQGSAAATSQAAERRAQQTESRQSYWQYGLVLMIATLVAESVVGRA
jgi:Aerotolerance regulator N-terminal/von Willebrand factor type A domain